VPNSPRKPVDFVDIIRSYDPDLPLAEASTIPAGWYVDERVFELELRTVFARSWQLIGRVDQVARPGQFVACELPGGEPVVVVRADDGILRGFFNVCRHHAAAVVTEPEGVASILRCPYHGWTYALDGRLKGTPDFADVCGFDRAAAGLVELEVGCWENWVFVKLDDNKLTLDAFLGPDLIDQVARLGLAELSWVERRHYSLACNWKVFIDNYLDGGYHVPHLHKGLNSVLDYGSYTIENGERYCLQSSPLVSDGADVRTGAVRSGERARYYWIYPNLMLNCYGGAMDTNLVIPRAVDRTEVVFDFFFADVSESARVRNRASIEVSEQIQDEDVAICVSVQRGLSSRAYTRGRLSVRREAGAHLFHRLLFGDLELGLGNPLARRRAPGTR
jgi:phenylpropionate dioxygenase-like ring-hydroxylating dioxygenase large terminal subunit